MFTGIIFLTFSSFVLFLHYMKFRARQAKKTSLPTNWPIFGMLPAFIWNIGCIHEYMTKVLEESEGTILLKGPVFTNMDMLFTCDPANINYILVKNFGNFSKGPRFKKIFDLLGDGIFIAEGESWENQRRIAKLALSHTSLRKSVVETTWRKMEAGLMPILEQVSGAGVEVDLQELLNRFAFDCSCILVLGHDPASLHVDLPRLPYLEAFVDAEEAALLRHALPDFLWKLQKWFHIGKEKKMSQAKEALDQFLSHFISLKDGMDHDAEEDMDMLASYKATIGHKGGAPNVSNQVRKDFLLNLIFAGKDTISATLAWFFWLLATNPEEEETIRREISASFDGKEPGKWKFSDMDALNKLIYLHGTLCETLRLFPPVPIQHKAPLKHDTLPSGHRIKANTITLPLFYAMGRMESIWGKDCCKFKPGRWITDAGCIKAEPSYKFAAFNAGPRSCLGKEISFIQMKIVAAAIISRFRIEVAEGHLIRPNTSVILHMKHGLRVKVSKYA